jgi:hypothetical protein
LSALPEPLLQEMLNLPEPEKTAIRLHGLVGVATDLIFVPVRSSPKKGLVEVFNFPRIL